MDLCGNQLHRVGAVAVARAVAAACPALQLLALNENSLSEQGLGEVRGSAGRGGGRVRALDGCRVESLRVQILKPTSIMCLCLCVLQVKCVCACRPCMHARPKGQLFGAMSHGPCACTQVQEVMAGAGKGSALGPLDENEEEEEEDEEEEQGGDPADELAALLAKAGI